MRILYDHSAFNQTFGGVSKYFIEIIKNIATYDVELKIMVKFSNNYYLRQIKNDLKQFLPKYHFRGKPKLEMLIGDFILFTYILFSRKYDIFHATHYNTFPKLILPSKTKFVATIHDMNYWIIPEQYTKFNFKRMRQFLHMKYSDQIIAVSNQTKKDIIKYYPEFSNKIEVIHHGFNKFNEPELCELMNLPKIYILYVGARNKYKNFHRLLEVFKRLKIENKKLHLICVGQPFTRREREVISRLSLKANIISISASDEQLGYLYKNARMFVFPSMYEGFGLPCLEAMSVGCPMAVADNSVFPEVCGPSSIYFDPYSSDSMYAAMRLVLYNEKCRKRLKDEMSKRFPLFTWSESARKHFLLYKRLIENE